jgi:hypothetical protein
MQLYKRGCTRAELISAATPIEGIFVNLHKKFTRDDPRSDLFANNFEAYQQTAVAMVAKERAELGIQMTQYKQREFAKRCSQTCFRAI